MSAEEFLVAEIQKLREENATLISAIERLKENQEIEIKFAFDVINRIGDGEWRVVLKDGVVTVETESAKEKENDK